MKLHEALTAFSAVHVETRATRNEALATIEDVRREFQSQLKEVKARTDHRRGTGNGAASWTVLRRKFVTVVNSCWTRLARTGHGIPKGSTYEETL